jgi:hypothetical protein
MKKTLVASLFLILAAVSNGSLDVAVTWGQPGDYSVPIDRFVVSNSGIDTTIPFSFYIHTRYPQGDMGGIDLLDDSFDTLYRYICLDDYIPHRNPQIIVYKPYLTVNRLYDIPGEDIWHVQMNPISPVILTPGPLVEFVYVPEPATLLLLGLGAFVHTACIRSRKTQ